MKNRTFLQFIGQTGKALDLLSRCLLSYANSVILELNLILLPAKRDLKYICCTSI